MNSFFSFIALILCWIISFVKPSGWSQIIELPQIINIIIVSLSVIFYFALPYKHQNLPKWTIFGLILTFIVIPYLIENSLEGAEYLTAFLIVYIFSQCKITERVINLACWAIGIGGIAILYIYTNSELLLGWNDNSISMVGFFSFLFFSIQIVLKRKTKFFWFFNIITFIYLYFLFETECRSGMLFSVLTVVSIYFISFTRRLLKSRKNFIIILNIPLIVALLVLLIASNHDLLYALDNWSMEKFDKTIFNGRNFIWEEALEYFNQSYWMGTGEFLLNYHNSCIAVLSVFGILGYIYWIRYFYDIYKCLQNFLLDPIIMGCVISFTMIYIQQSVDLGFISTDYNMIPYMILGIALSRIFLINKNNNHISNANE